MPEEEEMQGQTARARTQTRIAGQRPKERSLSRFETGEINGDQLVYTPECQAEGVN